MKKKLIALLSAAALAATLGLAGCGASQSSSASAAASASPAASAQASSASASAASTAASTASAPAASAAASQAAPAATTQNNYIGDQAAINAALSHAGFAQGDVYDLSVELDLDDAVVHYDVDFKQGGMEYDYDINATTGEIIYSKAEVDD